MRNTSKKLALPAIAAATAALGAAGLAKADFTFVMTSIVGTGANAGMVDYYVNAINTGTNGTGSLLESVDATVTSSATMSVYETNTGTAKKPNWIADILGTDGSLSAGATTSAYPFLGTAIGLAKNPTHLTVTSAIANGVDDTNAASYTGQATQAGLGAMYSALTSLHIEGAWNGSGDPATGTGDTFINIVVPSTAKGTAVIEVAGESGAINPAPPVFATLSFGNATPPPSAIVSLTSSTPTGYGSSVGALHVVGGGGSYAPVVIPGLSTAAGYSAVSGFTPTSDTEIFLLKLSSSAKDAALIADINASGGSVGGLVASAPAGLLANLGGTAWDIELSVTNPGALANGDFGFNLGNTTDGAGISVTEVAAVPEPATLGLLALSGIGLLARRRRA